MSSPNGRPWWRSVEMTAYYRYVHATPPSDQEMHWELLARSERHGSDLTYPSDINRGVRAPAGTATWPGYPFGRAAVNTHCLGSSYHGNAYLDGRVLFEKELSHIAGYGSQRATVFSRALAERKGEWFGLKFVARNAQGDNAVRLELWYDATATNTWTKLTDAVDTPGAWPASSDLDDCTDQPFSYTQGQLISWSGPWLIFRSDGMAMNFRWLSAREIAPLP